jgi:3-oxoacyl-[acyl-carrier-protein] synthase II
MTKARNVVVTGIGLHTPLGDRERTWEGLNSSRSGICQIGNRFSWAERAGVAGWIELGPEALRAAPSKVYALAYSAARDALVDARLELADHEHTELVIGNNSTELDAWSKQAIVARRGRRAAGDSGPLIPDLGLSPWLRQQLRLRGVGPILATNCVAGAQAIQCALSWIVTGAADRVLAGGVDCGVTAEMIGRFASLRALAAPPHLASSRPFDARRHGFVIADGAGFLVLETEELARTRDVEPYGRVCGFGMSSDTYHVTRGAPTPDAKLAAMRGALHMAALRPADIRVINAHATSTIDNDRREFEALRALFGARLEDIVITANKSSLGHSLAGAGAIETAVSLLILRDGLVPPILNLEEPAQECCSSGLAVETMRVHPGPILKTAFAFGGLNICLALAPV